MICLSARVSRALCRLSCCLSRRLSHQDLHPVGMGIMPSIRSEIDAILREEIELAQKDDPALIVRSAFEVIEEFLSQGMSLERIAAALQKNDIKVTKGHLVRHLGIVRKERGLQPLQRGRKPRTLGASTQAPATPCLQNTPHAPPNTARAAPSSAAEPQKPATMDTDLSEQVTGSVQQIGANQITYPDEITRLKFIEVRGELLDVTKMNIDDYLTVSKAMPDNRKIPDGMFDIIAAENRIRGMYERALSQYDDAIVKWKACQ